MANENDVKPCLRCTRVKDPGNCENKNCKQWRGWFIDAWERARNNPALQRELKCLNLETVSIGGTHYAHPDRVREYLQEDPCKSCPLPPELCTSPCPVRRSWEEARKELRE